MFGRSGGFGSQPSTFGFGATAANTFGQSNQLFGTTPSGFSNSTPVFGSSNQPMFGSTQSSTAPLFGSTNATSFGQPSQTGFGSSLFGSNAQPSSSGIFGTTTNSFGQQNKPTGFGFPSSSGAGLFSQNTQQNNQNATSVFQSTTTNSLFGGTNTFNSNGAQLGTVIKFVPVTGTDSVQKSGIVQSINTKHYCITCMKEYEGKSLEELRYEDYQCNRKGQQPFGQQQPFGISSTSNSIFGQPDKSTFGSPRNDFGNPGFGINTQTTTANIFAKPTTGFGTATSSSAFPFSTNTSSSGLFGSSTTAKPFATSTNQMFGSTQPQQSTFGNVFNQTNTNNAGGLFGKPPTTGFNTAQTGFTFGTPQQNQTNLFQTAKPNTGFGIFGQNNTQAPTFGQQQSAFGLNSTFGKPVQAAFGQPTQPTFDFVYIEPALIQGAVNDGSINTDAQVMSEFAHAGIGTNSIFGNNQNKPLFGTSTGGSFFGNTFQQNTPFQLNTQPQQPQASTGGQAEPQELQSLVQLTDPYGYSKHLKGLSPLKPVTPAYVTNPKDLQKLLEFPPPIAVVSPMNKRLQVLPITAKKTNLFDEIIDVQDINFTLRSSGKRLIINKQKVTDEGPQITQLNIEDTADATQEANNGTSKEENNGTSQSAPKPDIAPINHYKEQKPEENNDSISSLITINTNLMKDVTPVDPVPVTSSPTVNNHENTHNTEVIDVQETIENDKPIDTCGVKLTRPEYYTVPSLEKLIEHKQADGRCLVQGFTIGRVAYGNVCYPDLMDISNLDLDELVHFRYREVTVYPDDKVKPPEGQGLNRRAQVTLDRVYPKSKADRKLITDPEMLIAINFSDTLRDLCEKHETKFLDYRPETGSWVFMVDHFSKYGFTDSDNDELTNSVEHQKMVNGTEFEKKKDQEKPKKELASKEEEELKKQNSIQNGLLVNQDYPEDLNCSNKEIIDGEIYDVDMVIEEDLLHTHGASIENLDFDYSNFSTPSTLHHINGRQSLYECSPKNIFFMKASLYEDEDFIPVDIGDHNIETITAEPPLFKEFQLPMREIQKPIQPIQQVSQIRPDIFCVETITDVPIITRAYSERNYSDIAAFKGASFKVGWGRGLTLSTQVVFTSPGSSPTYGTFQANGFVRIVDVSGFQEFDPFVGMLERHLKIVLDTSDIVMQPNNIPLFTIRPGRACLLRHQSLAQETAKINPGNMSATYYQQIWDLCTAFWGPMLPPTTRRDLFSAWLESVVELDIEEELATLENNTPDAIYHRIFLYLTGNHITEAAELAENVGLCNLSLLLSELSASEKTKLFVTDQLDYWRTCSAFEHIHPALQKIYMLIAGQSLGGSADPNSMEPVNVCDNLDWKRCLALMLWYISACDDGISTALELYTEDFEETGFSVKPFPPYSMQENFFDVTYHLMLLHCGKEKSLETVLEPETHSFISTDYRLSWLLLHTLQSLQVGIIGNGAKTFITTTFAEQLESIGLYKWAVFVLLFVEDITLRKNYIMAILDRNLRRGDADRIIEDEMVTELCLPLEWIHEVKAYKANVLSRHWEAFKHFAYTGHWLSGQDVALKYIIPQLIVNDQLDTMGYVLRDIEPGCRSIMNWQSEGGLLLMFLDLYEKFQEKQKFSREEALSVHTLLIRVCVGITKFPVRHAAQVAALSEISKYCYLYGKILIDQLQSTYLGTMQIISTQLDELIMPPDYKLYDIQSETRTLPPPIEHDDNSIESLV